MRTGNPVIVWEKPIIEFNNQVLDTETEDKKRS